MRRLPRIASLGRRPALPAALLLALVLAAIAPGAGPRARAQDAGAPSAPSAPAVAWDLVATLRDYDVHLEPATVAPGVVRIAVANAGQRRHNLRLKSDDAEAQTPDLLPGEGATLAVALTRPGVYALFCDVAYHQQKGMVAVLTVGEGSRPPDGS